MARIAAMTLGLGASLVALVSVGTSVLADDVASRYPYDPVCAWGRIANGRGLFVRCLSADEAALLRRAPGPAPVGTAVPAASASTLSGAPTASPPRENLVAELVSVRPDEGELELAMAKLGAPLERYASCVRDHAGLQARVGEVHVRFMVQERGRAEGSSAEKYRGMTYEAAQCIADVVDRRPVGTPAAPVVGATAIIRVRPAP